MAIRPFAVNCINKQLAFGLRTDYCICIGEGENYKFLTQLNEENNWFKEIKAVAHPRFIMQYKLKEKDGYIANYIRALKS